MQKKIATKVSNVAYDRLERLSKKSGYKSIYELLQVILSCFLRFADPDGEALSEEDKRSMPYKMAKMFEGWENARTAYNSVSVDQPTIWELRGAIYFLDNNAMHKIRKVRKLTTMMIKNDEVVMSANRASALSLVLRNAFQDLEAKIVKIQNLLRLKDEADVIAYLLHEYEEDEVARSVQGMFNDMAMAEPTPSNTPKFSQTKRKDMERL